MPSYSLSLSQLTDRTEEEEGVGQWTQIFPAGALTPPWAHQRPSLFDLCTGYMMPNSVLAHRADPAFK